MERGAHPSAWCRTDSGCNGTSLDRGGGGDRTVLAEGMIICYVSRQVKGKERVYALDYGIAMLVFAAVLLTGIAIFKLMPI